ncbi:zinc-ribbon domain-containing protein [Haloterrigena turkmenica]|uniref:zinc-ribbon domain-containing protein n=1 Tax=Haloterrigena turkmenica TaxID=62320 RepID=UPI0031B62BC1
MYCRGCGAEIREEAEICPECGIRQKPSGVEISSDGLTEEYSVTVWIGSIILGLTRRCQETAGEVTRDDREC